MPPFFLPGYAHPAFRSPAARDRVDQFRAMHRIGERIVGVFYRWEGPGLGWVEFQGGPLLASMASQPEPGTKLRFLVKQLYPDIVLQEMFPQDKPGVLALLQRFWAGQNRLETRLSQLGLATSAHFSASRALLAFKQLLDTHPELHRELLELSSLTHTLNMELEHRGLGRFFCLPWLAGPVREAGLLVPTQSAKKGKAGMLAEAQFVCSHPLAGRMEAHFVLAPDPAKVTLYLERVELEPLLTAWLNKWFSRPPRYLELCGVKELSGGWRSGILARLLLPWEYKTAGLHVQA